MERICTSLGVKEKNSRKKEKQKFLVLKPKEEGPGGNQGRGVWLVGDGSGAWKAWNQRPG